MQKLKLLLLPLTALSIFLIAEGCQSVEDFPDEPQITFKSFETEGPNSAVLKINFTDGDGDIGLSEADTLPPFCPEECDYYYNLLCEYYEKQDGEWVIFVDLAAPFYYRVPIVEPSGQNPTLEGEIHIDLNAYYITGTGYDTCRMSVKLIDRSLNESNEVFTRTYTKPN